MNVVDEHHRLWPDEPQANLGSYGYGQDFIHDPMIISSSDGGITWSLTTTAEFLSQRQDEDISNSGGI